MRSQLVITTALVGYGRRAYTGCANSGGTTYLCTSANTVPISIGGSNAQFPQRPVSAPIPPAVGSGVGIHGAGAESFTDAYGSTITNISGTYSHGVVVQTYGDAGSTPGSATINLTGAAHITVNRYGLGAFVNSGGVTINTGANSYSARC